MLNSSNKIIDEDNRLNYLEERTKCYKKLRKVFNPATRFKEKLLETKYLCEHYSYFSECFWCLLAIFYLLPNTEEAEEYFSDISSLYLQICKYFSKSDYFHFFTVQMARFICQMPIGGELKYFQITNLVLNNLKVKENQKETKDYLIAPWEHKTVEEI